MYHLCLDRSCQWQEMGPHLAHNKDADFLSIEIDPSTYTPLEHLKAECGRRCWNCARYLIPTDKDHSFCEDCWWELMAHPLDDDGFGFCNTCGYPKEHSFHDQRK